MSKNAEITFAGMLGPGPLEGLHSELARATDEAASRVIFARDPDNGTALAVILFEGVVGFWEACGPVDIEQANQWAKGIRERVSRASDSDLAFARSLN
ncbi:MAG: hypothetical protein J0L65_12605 [Xanthomonadales bacterium]|nr:hypothetical protein [Xanthomonadales bacterium]